MAKGVFIVKYDDWKGLYVDGRLAYENHSIADQEIADLMAGEPFTLAYKWVEQMPEAGRFPETRAELDEIYDWDTGNLNPGFPAMEE